MVWTRRGLLLLGIGAAVILTDVSSVASTDREPTPIQSIPTPALAAHRGGADLHPENTLVAFENISRDHPGMILEMDVRALGDGTLVINHDATTDRTRASGKSGPLAGMTAADWRGVRIKHPAGGDPAPAVTLQDVLDRFGGTETLMFIELKTTTARGSFIEALWPYRGQVMVASFTTADVSVLARSGFATMQLSTAHPSSIVKGVSTVGVRSDNITAQTIREARMAGAKVWAWGGAVTPDRTDLLDLGVAGLIADDPRRAES